MSSGTICMLWSSWERNSYAVGVARSSNGAIDGEWGHEEDIWPENGWHGMMFDDLQGNLLFDLHSPNDKLAERPHFYKLVETENQMLKLILK